MLLSTFYPYHRKLCWLKNSNDILQALANVSALLVRRFLVGEEHRYGVFHLLEHGIKSFLRDLHTATFYLSLYEPGCGNRTYLNSFNYLEKHKYIPKGAALVVGRWENQSMQNSKIRFIEILQA